MVGVDVGGTFTLEACGWAIILPNVLRHRVHLHYIAPGKPMQEPRRSRPENPKYQEGQ